MIILLWFLLACLVISLPVTFLKKYIETSNPCYIIYAMIFYGFLSFLYLKLLRNNDISFMYTILNIISILTVSLIGIFYFGDKINIYKTIGIILSIISIIFLLL